MTRNIFVAYKGVVKRGKLRLLSDMRPARKHTLGKIVQIKQNNLGFPIPQCSCEVLTGKSHEQINTNGTIYAAKLEMLDVMEI